MGYFAITNAVDGFIVLQRKLDYEGGPRYFSLNITVSDRGEPILSNWTSLVVLVADEDDQDPFFFQQIYESIVTEELDVSLRPQAVTGDLRIHLMSENYSFLYF